MSTLLTKMQQSRAAKKADLDLLLEKSTPTADDATRAEGLIAEIRDLDAGIAAQAEADERRAAILRSHSEKYGDGIESGADLVNASASPYGPVRVMSEPSTYTERGERQGGPSFLVDLFRAQVKNDSQAHERLARHGREVESLGESRAVKTGDVPSFVPPQYLVSAFAEYARAGRPLVNQLTSLPLPDSGLSVVIPKVTTASTVDSQATQATTIETTDLADTSITVPVTTVAGYVPVARQALERGVMVEEMVFGDLASAYAAQVDTIAITAALAQSSTNAITFTDTDPTVVELWPKLADAAGRIRSNRFTGPTAFVLHPRRWAWLQAATSTGDERPLLGGIASGPSNVMATETNPQYGGAVATLLGVPVVLDANLPVNLGSGTNEDVILVADWRDSVIMEDNGGVPTQLKFEADGGTTLSVNLVAYGYHAVTFSRQPASISKITGTGLVTPAL